MNLELHHVGILCDDFEESLRFYRDVLCLQVVARHYHEDRVDMALLSDRSPWPTFLLALHGRPLSGWAEADYQAKGAQLHSLGFVANNLDKWHEQLSHTPLQLEEFPDQFPSARVLSVRDPSGVHAELLEFSDPVAIPKATSISRSASGRGDIGIEYWLSSVSINCRNTSEVANELYFYREELCLAVIRDHPDLAMLTDGRATAQAGIDLFVSEPRLWEPQGVVLTPGDPGLHYLCLRVRDLSAAHRDLLRQGVECTLEPVVTEHYDIACYRDPSGVDILVGSTPWPEWGDGFRDKRSPAYDLTGTG